MIAKLNYPLYIKKGKAGILTGNLYRNLHWATLAKAKKDYHEEVKNFVESLPKYNKLTIHYTLYFGNKRKRDIDNFTWALHKFLMDAMVEHGAIKDDHNEIVTGFSSHFGGYDDNKEDYVILEIEGEECESTDTRE